jgi:hypothetical protein
MMLKVFPTLAMASVLTLAPVLLSAQVTPPRGGQRQRLELERRLQQGFQRSIQTQLGWDQAQMEGLRGIMRSFQQERMVLNRAQASLRHRLRDPALQDLGEEDATALLQEMLEIQQRELDLYKREQEEFLRVMNPVELVRFYRLRENLGQRIQQMRQGGGRGGGIGAGIPLEGGGPGGRIFR